MNRLLFIYSYVFQETEQRPSSHRILVDYSPKMTYIVCIRMGKIKWDYSTKSEVSVDPGMGYFCGQK